MMKKIYKSLMAVMMLSQVHLLNANQVNNHEKKIQIDIVSDVVCPWCAIGYKRLSNAIAALDIEDKVEILWHPYELNPNMPRDAQNANEYLMKKLGLNKQELIEKRKSVTQTGKEAGFKFDYYSDMKKPNTLNAHILLAYAKKHDKQTQLKVRLQEAYYAEKKDIGSIEVLYHELKKVGLNADEAIKTLDDPKIVSKIREEEQYWKDKGVYAIPTMFFNNSIKKVGAHQEEVYEKLLMQLLN